MMCSRASRVAPGLVKVRLTDSADIGSDFHQLPRNVLIVRLNRRVQVVGRFPRRNAHIAEDGGRHTEGIEQLRPQIESNPTTAGGRCAKRAAFSKVVHAFRTPQKLQRQGREKPLPQKATCGVRCGVSDSGWM